LRPSVTSFSRLLLLFQHPEDRLFVSLSEPPANFQMVSMRFRILPIEYLSVALLSSLLFASCSKTADYAPVPQTVISGFHISESRLILLQGNAASKAVVFNWADADPNDTYTIEADVSADFFSDPIELISTKEGSATFNVADFNKLMGKLLYAGNTGKIDFRVRVDRHGAPPFFSAPTAMFVTTYQNFISYDASRTFKVPGNYQGWNVAAAPKLIAAKTPGEYEGYINFVNPSPQVLLVRGNAMQWDDRSTYYYIGADMFGFGGSIMTVPGGSGVYLFKANTNTNRWSSVKINSWDIAGDAVNTSSQPVMSDDDGGLAWSVTTDLTKGSFRIRANNSNAISFGHRSDDEPGVPSYDGENILVKRAGNYTIQLSLNVAGNYSYSVRRNS
jgi:hypothetical protein